MINTIFFLLLILSIIIYYVKTKKKEDYYNKILKIKKRIFKLKIKHIAKDGNCFFSSIADQLYNEPRYHEILRKKLYYYLENKRNCAIEKIPYEIWKLQSFASTIKIPQRWIDSELQIKCMSSIINREICIIQKSEKEKNNIKVHIKGEKVKSKKKIFLYLDKDIHYESIKDMKIIN